MYIGYKPLLPRQSVLIKELVLKIKIDKINSECFTIHKNQIFHYIILNSEPNYIYMFNVIINKRGLYGHSSFPIIDNNIYNHELNSKQSKIQNNFLIKYAGNIAFDSQGYLKYWNNSSGHYKPNATQSIYIKLDNSKFTAHKSKISWADKVAINK